MKVAKILQIIMLCMKRLSYFDDRKKGLIRYFINWISNLINLITSANVVFDANPDETLNGLTLVTPKLHDELLEQRLLRCKNKSIT